MPHAPETEQEPSSAVRPHPRTAVHDNRWQTVSDGPETPGPAVIPVSGPRDPAAAKTVAAVPAATGGERHGPSERAARAAREASRPSPAAPDARRPDGDDRTERLDPVPARAVVRGNSRTGAGRPSGRAGGRVHHVPETPPDHT